MKRRFPDVVSHIDFADRVYQELRKVAQSQTCRCMKKGISLNVLNTFLARTAEWSGVSPTLFLTLILQPESINNCEMSHNPSRVDVWRGAFLSMSWIFASALFLSKSLKSATFLARTAEWSVVSPMLFLTLTLQPESINNCEMSHNLSLIHIWRCRRS